MDNKKYRPQLDSQSKLITLIIVVHGLICISLSYVLAFKGLDPVVNVSETLITEIVAPIITFLITHSVENIFKYNKLSFSEPLEYIYKTKDEKKSNDVISDSPK